MIDAWTMLLSQPQSEVIPELMKSWSESPRQTVTDTLSSNGYLERVTSTPDDGGVIFTLSNFYFKKQGRQTFEVGAGLTEALMKTEMKDRPLEDLKLPYPTFYIDAPSNIILDGVKVARDAPSFFGVLVTTELPQLAPVVLSTPVFYPDSSELSLPYLFPEINEDGTVDLSHVVWNFLAAFLLTLQSGVGTKTKSKIRDSKKRKTLEKRLMMSSSGGRKNLLRRIDRLPLAVTYLGSNGNKSGDPKAYGKRVIRRHWVRGHDHRYWTGPKSRPDKRELITKFTAPYEKCVDNDPAADAHLYRMTDKPK
jgi:hypothetical protein